MLGGLGFREAIKQGSVLPRSGAGLVNPSLDGCSPVAQPPKAAASGVGTPRRETTRRSELGVSVHTQPSFERESRKTHSLKRGPDVTPSAVHNLCRRDT